MPTSNFKVYQQFNSSDIISGKLNQVSSGYFPGGEVYYSQSLFLTSSAQAATSSIYSSTNEVLNGLYYTEVFNNDTINPQVLFSVAYGNAYGSGSSNSNIKQTKAIYSQYKNILLGTADVDGLFSFRSGSANTNNYVQSADIFVINFSSILTTNQIDPGQWCLYLSGSNGLFSIIDESPILQSSTQNPLVYEIISGSYSGSVGTTVDAGIGYTSLGLFYPNNGMIVLNASAVSNLIGTGSLLYPAIDTNYPNGSYMDQYQLQLYNALQNVPTTDNTGLMRIRKSEFVPSTQYFVRVMNQDYNFSNNPTFIYNQTTSAHSRGDIINSLVSKPTTYVTTVGLYNNLNELVAVAKLSNPTRKDFNSEILVKIRLDF